MLSLGIGVGHAGDEVGNDARAGGICVNGARRLAPAVRHVRCREVAVEQVGDEMLAAADGAMTCAER